MTPYSTGNYQLSPFWTHMTAIGAAALVYYSSDQAFMSHLPVLARDIIHPAVSLITYLGITQVQAAQPPIAPK